MVQAGMGGRQLKIPSKPPQLTLPGLFRSTEDDLVKILGAKFITAEYLCHSQSREGRETPEIHLKYSGQTNLLSPVLKTKKQSPQYYCGREDRL